MGAPFQPREVYDTLGSFELGMDSSKSPLLLPKNQASFLTNVTVRGSFATHRPPVKKLTLDYGGDSDLQAAVEKGLHQGGGFYRSAINGNAALFDSISGRIFEFKIDGDKITVVERTVPGDPNPDSTTQAWMWQSEDWIIVNDGISLPLFIDDQTSRRSYGPSISKGTVTAVSTPSPPDIGTQLVLTLSAPFPGPFNVPLFFNNAFYQPIENSAGYNVTLTNLFDTPGNPIPLDAQVVVQPSIFGLNKFTLNLASYGGNTFPPEKIIRGVVIDPGVTVTFELTAPSTNPVGTKVILFGKRWRLTAISGNNATFINEQTVTIPASLTAGTFIPIAASSAANIIIGAIAIAAVVPAVGTGIPVTLTLPYTGAAGQIVYIGTGQYTITAIPASTNPLLLTVINLSDAPQTPAVNYVVPQDIFSVSELPAGRMGAYGMGRNWESLVDGRGFMGGDIVGGPAGTQAYNFRDSVLKNSENEFLLSKGNFTIPSTGGDIRALVFTANLDTSLGQGPLQIFTPFGVFSCNAPVELAEWQNLTNPILTQSLIGNGGLAQNSTILVNGDTFFRSIIGLRSLVLARRFFDSPGNSPISQEMVRVYSLDNPELLGYGSAMLFDNRHLQTASPQATAQGVLHAGTVVMNLDPGSTLQHKLSPVYDGLWTGLNVLQYLTGLVNGVQRAFAFTYDVKLEKIELYEILSSGFYDNGTTPITWAIESASLFNKDVKREDEFMRLMNGEVGVTDVIGRVDFQTFYKPHGFDCWVPWHQWSICVEPGSNPVDFPAMGLGEPDPKLCDPSTGRPYRDSLTYQVKLIITGHCTLIRLRAGGVTIPTPAFAKPICNLFCNTPQSFTARCSEGEFGNPVTVTIPADTVSASTPQDADVLALEMAKQQAFAAIKCTSSCPEITVVDEVIADTDETWTDPDFGTGFNIRKFPFAGFAGQHINIVVDSIAGGIGLAHFYLLDANSNIIQLQHNVNDTNKSYLGCDIPADGNYFIGVAWLTGGLPVTVSFHSIGCFPNKVPCSIPPDMQGKQWAVNDYTNGLITIGACAPQPSADPAWNGTILHFFDNSPITEGWFSDFTNLSISGQIFCETDLFIHLCATGEGTMAQTFWEVEVDFGGGCTAMWKGRKYIGADPAGVYDKFGGCSTGPATLTVTEL